MAENADGQEKSEAPSGKRLTDARDKGQVAKSADVTSAAVLLFGGLLVYNFGGRMMTEVMKLTRTLFLASGKIQLNSESVPKHYQELIVFMGLILVPLLALIAVVAFLGEVAQIGFKFSPKKFTEGLNFQKILNPFQGLGKLMLSKDTMVELLKGIVKTFVIGVVVYWVISSKYDKVVELMVLPFQEMGPFLWDVSFELVYKVGLVYILIGLGDFFWQKHKFTEQMKMTKQEVKEESKQQEGDLQAKARMRQISKDRLRKVMLQRVKKADVVITNPTHYAVALEYKLGKMDAPIVVAKGIDFLALKIKEIAKDNNVPIVEDRALAQSLYKLVEIDQAVPEDLFRAVAQVLAYVWRLRDEKKAA